MLLHCLHASLTPVPVSLTSEIILLVKVAHCQSMAAASHQLFIHCLTPDIASTWQQLHTVNCSSAIFAILSYNACSLCQHHKWCSHMPTCRTQHRRAHGKWKLLRQLRTWQPRVAPLELHSLHLSLRPRRTASGTPSSCPSASYTCRSHNQQSSAFLLMKQHQRRTVE